MSPLALLLDNLKNLLAWTRSQARTGKRIVNPQSRMGSAAFRGVVGYIVVFTICGLVGCNRQIEMPEGVSGNAESETRQMVATFTAHGKNLNEAQEIRYEFAFPTEADTMKAKARAEEAGYKVTCYKSPNEDCWTCTIRRKVVPSSPELKQSFQFAFDLAKQFGGNYTEAYIGTEPH